MCLAVPSKVVALGAEGRAEVECFGVRRPANLSLLEEPPRVGDYVLLRAGGYAVEVVDEERALEALAHFAGDGLEAAFERIQHERMQDVPLLNPALRVEALGFAPWNGHWLGALISPWFVNLVVVRGACGGWKEAAEGEAVTHAFPCGTLPFLGAAEPEVGDFATCALSTAMHEFASQEAAREFARAALDELRRTPERRPVHSRRQFLHL